MQRIQDKKKGVSQWQRSYTFITAIGTEMWEEFQKPGKCREKGEREARRACEEVIGQGPELGRREGLCLLDGVEWADHCGWSERFTWGNSWRKAERCKQGHLNDQIKNLELVSGACSIEDLKFFFVLNWKKNSFLMYIHSYEAGEGHTFFCIDTHNEPLPTNQIGFMGTRPVMNHRATHLDQARTWFKHSVVNILKSLIIFQKGFLHFFILLGPRNYKAGPAMIRKCRKLMWHE